MKSWRSFVVASLFALRAVCDTNQVVATLHGEPIPLSALEPSPALRAAREAQLGTNLPAIWVQAHRCETLARTILIPLHDELLQQKNAVPPPGDLEALRAAFHEKTGKELPEATARAWWNTWKFNQILYQEFGGGVALRDWGLEAVDALGAYLKIQEQVGTFTIESPGLRSCFYHYYRNRDLHQWYEGDPAPFFLNAADALRQRAKLP